MAGVPDIGALELAVAAAFMLVAGVISWRLELGLGRRLAVSATRLFVQLLACGFVLQYLFSWQTWWLVCLVFALMALSAARISTQRVRHAVEGLFGNVYLSLLVSSLTVTLVVTQLVLHAQPWFSAQQVVPVLGMILGNGMSATAVAVERLFSDLDARADEVETLVALGATPREAAQPSLRAAIAAGLTPNLSVMAASGVVTLPGMMSGQILAGLDPLVAAKYQIVVMLMLNAGNAIAVTVACFRVYRRRFADEGYYLSRALRDDAPDGKGPSHGARRAGVFLAGRRPGHQPGR